MRKTRLLLAAATVAVTLTRCLFAASRNDTAEAAIGGITWQDEFNGPAGTPLDQSKWKFDIGGSPDHLVPGRLGVLPDHPRQPGRRPLGLRPPVLHDPQRGRRRLLARQPGRQHRLSTDML